MPANHDDLFAAEKLASDCLRKMEGLIKAVAMARQIVGYRDERSKKELAVVQAEYLRGGDSAAASEVKARADARYHDAVENIITQTAQASETLLEFEVAKLQFENAQALMNNHRARMKIL